MPGTPVTEDIEVGDIGGSGGGFAGGSGDGSSGGGGMAAPSERVYVTGVSIALAGILMFFMALTSSYIVRKGMSGDWQPTVLPRVLWFNTLVLVASSVTIARARGQLGVSNDLFRRWWGITTALGLLFLAGQFLAWRELARAGVYLASNPSSSFFYVLTAAHGVHLLGGIAALMYVGVRASAQYTRTTRATAAAVASIYWHFMDALWVFLFLLLNLGR